MKKPHPITSGRTFAPAVSAALSCVALSFAVPAFADDPYIESDGTTGISTGYSLKPTSRIEVDFALSTAGQPVGGRLFGADDNNGAVRLACSLYVGSSSGNLSWVYSFGNGSNWTGSWVKDASGSFLLLDTERHVATFDFPGGRHSYYTDGTEIAWATDGYAYENAASRPFALFAAKTASGFEKPVKARIYGVRVYEKSGGEYVLVRDFRPCVATGQPGFRDDVATPGFRDEVTGVFIGSADAPESFSASAGVPVCTPAPYVATDVASAQQYIDTLYVATDRTRCDLDYSLQATPSASAWLFSGYGNATYGVYVKSGGSTFGMDNGGGWSNDPSIPLAGTLHVRRMVSLDFPNNKLHLVSGVETNASVSAKAVAGKNFSAHTLKVGGRFNGGSEFASIKVYGLRIYEAGELVRDFVPCWRDGMPGLKDALTGVFVSYPGTLGTKLACGGGISVEANPYVQTDAGCKQYFATGYQPVNTTRIELDYALAAVRPSGTWVLFRGNNSAYFGMYDNADGLGFINGNGWIGRVTSATLADATGIRRTASLDNVANLAALVTAGVTNASRSCVNKLPATKGGTAVTLSESEGFSATEYSSLRIYACRIYEGGVPVHEFLPAVKDDVAGLQDQLSDTFLPVLSKGLSNPQVYGGVFTPIVTPASARVSASASATLTAFAPGAASYRWLRNGEALEGGSDGTLAVDWSMRRRGVDADEFQAVAVFSVDGMTAESGLSNAVAVEYVPPAVVIVLR